MKPLALLALLALGAALAGCSAPAAAEPPPSSAPAPTAPATFDPEAINSAYHVSGGGQFVQGSRDVCDLAQADSILIEDAKATAHYDGSQIVTSMTLAGGEIVYSTIWPADIVTTGVTAGSGSYTVQADAHGVPVSITGTATVSWRDAGSKTTSKKHDTITLTLTRIPAPAYCTPNG